MTTVAQSPSPNKQNPDWSFQVKVGRGRSDTGAHHRAIDVARRLFEAGRWDGRGLLIVHDVYDVHARMQLGLPVADADFEFSEDSMYPREGMIMSILTESPFPNKIKTLYVPRPNFATGEIVWGFWLTVEGRSHYADWAMPTEQVVEVSRQLWEAEQKTAAYQYYMPYADSMALRPVEEA